MRVPPDRPILPASGRPPPSLSDTSMADTTLMEELALRCQRPALASRLGYLLEALGHKTGPRLLELASRSDLPLDLAGPAGGRKIPRWGIIDNVGVAHAR